MRFMMLWKQYMDYRCLEEVARSLVCLGIIPQYGDYTTIWYRIHDMMPALDISGMQYAELATDGTEMKTDNAGAYSITKYGDPDACRRKHLIVIITADVRTKKIAGIEAHIEGNGPSEPETASRHIREAVRRDVKIKGFYGDGAFDVNGLFNLTRSIGARPVIKISKNTSTEQNTLSDLGKERVGNH